MIKIFTSNWASKRMLSTILRVISDDDDSKERSFLSAIRGEIYVQTTKSKNIKIILSNSLLSKTVMFASVFFLSFDESRVRKTMVWGLEWDGVGWKDDFVITMKNIFHIMMTKGRADNASRDGVMCQ